MGERLFVSLRLVRLALIVTLAVLLAQVFPGQKPDGWQEFMSPVQLRGTAAEEYSTLGDLANEADMVVVGRISEIERGRELVAAPEFVGDPVVDDLAFVRFALARIEVERVLTKDVVAGPNIDVEILIIRWDQVELLQERLPNDRALFFLRHKADEADGRYFRLVNVHQGLIGSDAGTTVIPGQHDHGTQDPGQHDHADTEYFLADMNGRNFDEVIEQVEGEIKP